jgi:NAD(P)-dependent dehydrogenase (short-subunit alcohol dehydrogenase family)
MGKLEGEVAVITAATSGMALATAISFCLLSLSDSFRFADHIGVNRRPSVLLAL